MLQQVAEDVFVHTSEFLQSNSVIVQGREGVLLVDPGITREEMAAIAQDLHEKGQPVVVGFSTHPHWDHVLWHTAFGDAARYGTARCADSIREVVSQPGWEARVAGVMPPGLADDIPMDLLGLVTGLPAGTVHVPWDGPPVRILEHQAHAQGHAALVVEEQGVLIAGDMLSDILMPFLNVNASDPLEDYRAALDLLARAAADVDTVIPGHGSVGGAEELRARLDLDRAYVRALLEGSGVDDPRLGPSAPLAWLTDVHRRQVQALAPNSA